MTNSILLLGSSTIKKWKHFTLHLKNEQVINRGVSGLTTSSLLTNNYFDYITNGIKQQPKYIVFYCGINDIHANVENKEIVNNSRLFLHKLHKTFTNSRIIVISLIKSPRIYKEKKIEDVNYVNNKMRDFCSIKTPYLHYINVNKELNSTTINYFMNDGFHLNELGYEKMNKKILETVK